MSKKGLAGNPGREDVKIQGFSPRAEFCQVPETITAGSTYSDLDISDMTGVAFRPSADVQVYLNGYSTKYLTFDGAVTHVLPINNSITSIAFKNAGAASLTLELWGM